MQLLPKLDTNRQLPIFAVVLVMFLLGNVSTLAVANEQQELEPWKVVCTEDDRAEYCSLDTGPWVPGEWRQSLRVSCMSISVFEGFDWPSQFVRAITGVHPNSFDSEGEQQVHLNFLGTSVETLEVTMLFAPRATWLIRPYISGDQAFNDILSNLQFADEVAIHVVGEEPFACSLEGFNDGYEEWQRQCAELQDEE